VIDGRFALAFTTGLLAAVNPCGFAMLPAYLSFFLGKEAEEPDRSSVAPVGRALVVSTALTLGFLAVFVVLGAIIKAGGDTLYRWASYLTIGIGAGLAVLGVAMLFGYRPGFRPHLDRGGTNRSVGSIALFGVSYAITSLGCALPLFISNVLTSFTSRGVASGVVTFVMFSLGMGLLVTALTLTLALSQGGLLRGIRQLLPYVERISAVILVIAGVYFVYYGIYEVRGTTSGGGLALRLSDWQGRLATRINDVGPVTIGVVLGAVVVGAVLFVMRRRQSTP
jgi:cytochrome c biogenesis protein CcdA